MTITKQTIYEFVKQVKEITAMENAILHAAQRSMLTTGNSKDLESIAKLWNEGWYDNNPESIVPELRNILKLK